ncbi:MAG: Ig-like domain-containing protein [Pirellulales bacterium]
MLAADLVSLLPADGASSVDPNANLVLTFSDDVKAGPGAGRLLIMNAADDSVVEAVDISDPARVNFSGHTVTVDPVNPLPADAKLYISIDPGAIRDASTSKTDAVLFSENFETSHMLDSPLDQPTLNNYAVFMNGTLDVKEAGNYRFGIANDDGGYLAIDLNGDGKADINDAEDTIVFDDTTHGVTDFFSENSITLAKGEYKFEYMFFQGGGGSGGEFFYAKDDGTLPDPIAFDATKFAVVGDDSKGIGVTVDGIKATGYAAAAPNTVGTIQAALDMRDGATDLADGFPATVVIPTADVWNSGNKGHFSGNNQVPGFVPPPDADPHDYNANMPYGWTKDTNKPTPEPVYSGWTQLNKDFWIAQQGDQDRTTFTLGEGTVAVMDPDAFDDFSSIGPNHDLEAFTTLPAIDLTDVTASTVKIDFDSSFRPEAPRLNDDHPDWIGQTALVDVSFDGGTTWENVMLQNQETAGGTGSLDHANEHLSIEVPNPAGGSMLVRFGIVNASNDWWWSVDNIVVKGQAVGNTYAGTPNDRTTWNFATKGLPTLQGDFNGDGKVDLTDFGILKSNFGKTPAALGDGDANGDAKVDLTDFGILKENFGKSGAVATPAVVAQATDYAFAVGVAQAAKAAGGAAADPFADDSV